MISLVWKIKFIHNNSTGIRSALYIDRKESMDCGKENAMFYLTNKVITQKTSEEMSQRSSERMNHT